MVPRLYSWVGLPPFSLGSLDNTLGYYGASAQVQASRSVPAWFCQVLCLTCVMSLAIGFYLSILGRKLEAMAIASIVLGVSGTILTNNWKGGFPCLALEVWLDSQWLLEGPLSPQ